MTDDLRPHSSSKLAVVAVEPVASERPRARMSLEPKVLAIAAASNAEDAARADGRLSRAERSRVALLLPVAVVLAIAIGAFFVMRRGGALRRTPVSAPPAAEVTAVEPPAPQPVAAEVKAPAKEAVTAAVPSAAPAATVAPEAKSESVRTAPEPTAKAKKHEASAVSAARGRSSKGEAAVADEAAPATATAAPAPSEASQRAPQASPEPSAHAAPAVSAEASHDSSAQRTALECMSRGDSACVIRTLEGKETSPYEFDLLIATYRSVGDYAKAKRTMAKYLDRYPNGAHADEYRRVVEPPVEVPSEPSP